MSLLVLAAAIGLFAIVAWATCVRMPGRSYRGPLPPPTSEQERLAVELEADVRALAEDIGERSVARSGTRERAAGWIAGELRRAGFEPAIRDGNVVAELAGSPGGAEIVVVGAHYDSVTGSPGANDNASGVAATLALARRFARTAPARTLRFVAFADEEPPSFGTEAMGSRIDARGARERGEEIVAMLSLETLGCYSDEPGSQRYPVPLLRLAYPDRGDYVAFVGNLASRALVRRALRAFRGEASFPSQGAALPSWVPGVGWSDHDSFWRAGYPAIMVTDTALFRDPRYHTGADRPEHLDYDRMARVVEGLRRVVADLAGVAPDP